MISIGRLLEALMIESDYLHTVASWTQSSPSNARREPAAAATEVAAAVAAAERRIL